MTSPNRLSPSGSRRQGEMLASLQGEVSRRARRRRRQRLAGRLAVLGLVSVGLFWSLSGLSPGERHRSRQAGSPQAGPRETSRFRSVIAENRPGVLQRYLRTNATAHSGKLRVEELPDDQLPHWLSQADQEVHVGRIGEQLVVLELEPPRSAIENQAD